MVRITTACLLVAAALLSVEDTDACGRRRRCCSVQSSCCGTSPSAGTINDARTSDRGKCIGWTVSVPFQVTIVNTCPQCMVARIQWYGGPIQDVAVQGHSTSPPIPYYSQLGGAVIDEFPCK
jgi:hypothetical protein